MSVYFTRIQLINLKVKIILFCMKIYVYIELRIKKFFICIEYYFNINL